MKVTTVVMPGMFSMKDDYGVEFSAPYTPMPYRLGDVCEKCWLTVEVPTEYDHYLMSDWLTHEAAIIPAVSEWCPHGEPS